MNFSTHPFALILRYLRTGYALCAYRRAAQGFDTSARTVEGLWALNIVANQVTP
jgi:hypothetical protein